MGHTNPNTQVAPSQLQLLLLRVLHALSVWYHECTTTIYSQPAVMYEIYYSLYCLILALPQWTTVLLQDESFDVIHWFQYKHSLATIHAIHFQLDHAVQNSWSHIRPNMCRDWIQDSTHDWTSQAPMPILIHHYNAVYLGLHTFLLITPADAVSFTIPFSVSYYSFPWQYNLLIWANWSVLYSDQPSVIA